MNHYPYFTKTLIHWYLENKRDLPWRHTTDPYPIWVSETILQQTRVAQGYNYYNRFLHQFPDVFSLAKASDDMVMKAWEGLGYYSRARHMIETARFIVNHYQGQFPTQYQELVKLKGIGHYTAAAIASLAFGSPIAVVDGNVLRFFSRYFGQTDPIDSAIGIKRIREMANTFIDREQPGIFNQAMMEFGALQCVSANPVCQSCCFKHSCQSYKKGLVSLLPIRKAKIPTKTRNFNYLFIDITENNTNSFLIRKRRANDIWRNLYELPLIEAGGLLTQDELVNHTTFQQWFTDVEVAFAPNTDDYRHVLTHRVIHARFFKIPVSAFDGISFPSEYQKVVISELSAYPFPRLLANYFADQGIVIQ